MTEWITFMDALDKGLAHSSLEGFYNLGRMILVKTESDFDKFDIAFMEYFKNIKMGEDLPADIMKYLTLTRMFIALIPLEIWKKQSECLESVSQNRRKNTMVVTTG